MFDDDDIPVAKVVKNGLQPLELQKRESEVMQNQTRGWTKTSKRNVAIVSALAVGVLLLIIIPVSMSLSSSAENPASSATVTIVPGAPTPAPPNPVPATSSNLMSKLSNEQYWKLFSMAEELKLQDNSCRDDPNSLLKGFGVDCSSLSFACENDLSALAKGVPPGTFLKQLCPKTCDNCGNFTMKAWAPSIVCTADVDCQIADQNAKCDMLEGTCQCSRYFSGSKCQYEPSEILLDDLMKPAVTADPLDPTVMMGIPQCPEGFCPKGYSVLGWDRGSPAKELLGKLFSGFPTRRPARVDPTAADFENVADIDETGGDPDALKMTLMEVQFLFKGLVPLNAAVLFFFPHDTDRLKLEVAVRLYVPKGIDVVDLVNDQFQTAMGSNDMYSFRSPGKLSEGVALVVSSANFNQFGYSIIKGVNVRAHFQPSSEWWNKVQLMFSPRPRYPLRDPTAPFSVILRGYYPTQGGADAWGKTSPSVDVLLPHVRLNTSESSLLGQTVRAGKAQIRMDINLAEKTADPYIFTDTYFSFPSDNGSYLHAFATLSMRDLSNIQMLGGIYSYKLHGLEKWLGIKKIAVKAETDGLALPLQFKKMGLHVEAALKFGGVSNQPLFLNAVYKPAKDAPSVYGFQLQTGQMVINDIGTMACSFISGGCTPEHKKYLTGVFGQSTKFEANLTVANGDIALQDGTQLSEGVNYYCAASFTPPATLTPMLASFNNTGKLTARSFLKFGFHIPLAPSKIVNGASDVEMFLEYDLRSNNQVLPLPFTWKLLHVRLSADTKTQQYFVRIVADLYFTEVENNQMPLTMNFVGGYDGRQSTMGFNATQIGDWSPFPFLTLTEIKASASLKVGLDQEAQKALKGFAFSTTADLGFSGPIHIKGQIDPSSASLQMSADASDLRANMGNLVRMLQSMTKKPISANDKMMAVLNEVVLTDLHFDMSPTSLVKIEGKIPLPKGFYLHSKLTVWGAKIELAARVQQKLDPAKSTYASDLVVNKLSLSDLRPSMVPFLQPAQAVLKMIGGAVSTAGDACPSCLINVCIAGRCNENTFSNIGNSLVKGLDSIVVIKSVSIDEFSVTEFVKNNGTISLSMSVELLGEEISGSIALPASFFTAPMVDSKQHILDLGAKMFGASRVTQQIAHEMLANITLKLNSDDTNPLIVKFVGSFEDSHSEIQALQVGLWKPMPFLKMEGANAGVTIVDGKLSKVSLGGKIDIGLNASVVFHGVFDKVSNEMGFQMKLHNRLALSDIVQVAKFLSGSIPDSPVVAIFDSIFMDDFVFMFSPTGVTGIMKPGFRFGTNMTLFGAKLDMRGELVERVVMGNSTIQDFQFRLLLTGLKPSLVPFLAPADSVMTSFAPKIDNLAQVCPYCKLSGCFNDKCASLTLSDIADFVRKGLDNVLTVKEIGIKPFSMWDLLHGGNMELVLDATIMGVSVSGTVPVSAEILMNAVKGIAGGTGGTEGLPNVPSTSALGEAVKNMGDSVFANYADEIADAVFTAFAGNVSLQLDKGFKPLTVEFEGEMKQSLEFSMKAKQVGAWKPYAFLSLSNTTANVAFSQSAGVSAGLAGKFGVGGNVLSFSGSVKGTDVAVDISAGNVSTSVGGLHRMAKHFSLLLNGSWPKSCAHIHEITSFEAPKSGVYTVQPNPNKNAVQVWCDFSTAGMVWTMCGKFDRDNQVGTKFLERNFGRENQNDRDMLYLDKFTGSQASVDCRALVEDSTHMMAAGSNDGSGKWGMTQIMSHKSLGLNENMWNTYLDSLQSETCKKEAITSIDATGNFKSVGSALVGEGTGWTTTNSDGNVVSDSSNADCSGTTANGRVFFGWKDSKGKGPNLECGEHVGTFCSSTSKSPDAAPKYRYNFLMFGRKVVPLATDSLSITDFALHAEYSKLKKEVSLAATLELFSSQINIDAAVLERTVGGSKVGDGACGIGYTGVFSGFEDSLHLCQQRCTATPGCSYYAYCSAVNMEACLGEHKNKCAVYTGLKTCSLTSGSGGQWTGYSAYSMGSQKIIDIELKELSLTGLKSSFIPGLTPSATMMEGIMKKFNIVGNACPRCVMKGCIGKFCIGGTAAEIGEQIKQNINNWLVVNKLWISPISIYDLQHGADIVVNLDATLLGSSIKGSVAIPDFLTKKLSHAVADVGFLGDKSFKKQDDVVAATIYKNFASVSLALSADASPLKIDFSGAFSSNGHFTLNAKQVGHWKPLSLLDPKISLGVWGANANVEFTNNGLVKATVTGQLGMVSATLPFSAWYDGYTGESFAKISMTNSFKLSDALTLVKAINSNMSLPSIYGASDMSLTNFDLTWSGTGVPRATCSSLGWKSTGSSCNALAVNSGQCESSATYDEAARFCGQVGAHVCSPYQVRNLPAPAGQEWACYGSKTLYALTRRRTDGQYECLASSGKCSVHCNVNGQVQPIPSNLATIVCTSSQTNSPSHWCYQAKLLNSKRCSPRSAYSTSNSFQTWTFSRDFSVQITASGTVSIVLSPQASNQVEVYEIRQTTTTTSVHRQFGGAAVKTVAKTLPTTRTLWVTLSEDGLLSVGTGSAAGTSTFLSWRDPDPLRPSFLSIGARSSSVQYEQLCSLVASPEPLGYCSSDQRFWTNSACISNEFRTQGANGFSSKYPESCSHETNTAAAMCCTSTSRTVEKGLVIKAAANIWGANLNVGASLLDVMDATTGIPHDLKFDQLSLTSAKLNMIPAIQNANSVLNGVRQWILDHTRVCGSIVGYQVCLGVPSGIVNSVIDFAQSTMNSILASVLTIHTLRVDPFNLGKIAKNSGKLGFFLDMTVMGFRGNLNSNVYISDLTSIANGKNAVNVIAGRIFDNLKNSLINAFTNFGVICRKIKETMCVRICAPWPFDSSCTKVCVPMPC